MATVTNIDTAIDGTPGGRYSTSIASFTRPDNATPYTALDVISEEASLGAANALIFPNVTRSGLIRSISIANRLEDDAVTPRLFLFDAEPTGHADNATLALVTADVPKLLGWWDFPDADKVLVGTLLNYWFTATSTEAVGGVGRHPVPYTSADGNLYGLLQTVAGYTPIAETQFTIKLGLEHD